MALLIAACTNRKRVVPRPEMCGRALERGSIEAVSSEWLTRVSAAPPEAEAASLYSGRSVTEIRAAVRSAGAELAFLSAGLGVVCATTAVPSYSLTVSGDGPDAVLRRVTSACSALDWWLRLEQDSPFGTNLAELAKANSTLVARVAQNEG
jgi:hypothetical protein